MLVEMCFEIKYNGTAKTKLLSKVCCCVHVTLRQAQVITDSRLFVCYQRRLVIPIILSDIPNNTFHRL
jgi:hypothetical protein